MFDLDAIEKVWIDASLKLTEDEIQEIYQSEEITYNKDLEIRAAHRRHLLWMVYTDKRWEDIYRTDPNKYKNEIEPHWYLIFKEQHPFPPKKHLSKEMQHKVIKGSMDVVFDSTRKWYSFFAELISIEEIYYICLETLITGTHKMLHTELHSFRRDIKRAIEKEIMKQFSKWAHIPYKKAREVIEDIEEKIKNDKDFNLEEYLKNNNLSLNYKVTEEVEKPSKIYERIKNDDFDINFIRNVSSNQFMKDYYDALETLDEDSRLIMQLSFDKNGNPGLTDSEIEEYLGIDQQKVSNIRKKAIKELKNNEKLNSYRNN